MRIGFYMIERCPMQDSPRLFIDSATIAPLAEGTTLDLAPGHARYLGTVLRLGPEAPVRIFNERDGEWSGVLTAIRKDRGTLRVTHQTRMPMATTGPILVFAPLKRDATDLVIRMGTELGVSRFMPVTTARTNTHRVNTTRWHAIAVEAAEQCERLDVPVIDELRALSAVVSAWPSAGTLYAAVERHRVATPTARQRQVGGGDGLLIGPEGGFSPEETQWLLTQDRIEALSLGTLILRADTAACAGLAYLTLHRESSVETE